MQEQSIDPTNIRPSMASPFYTHDRALI